MAPIDYLKPDVPGELPWVDVPFIDATPEALEGYGYLVDEPDDVTIEIVQWPRQGTRPIDPGTGADGGTTSGTFEFWWDGDVLHGKNAAVGDQYVLGWADNPAVAAHAASATRPRTRVLMWHANYHPDGGQLFFPLDGDAFVAPLALPGDDVTPDAFVAFRFEGDQGLYIHPGVWHEGVFPIAATGRFYDEQGKVHARVSCNIAREFAVFLAIPLPSTS